MKESQMEGVRLTWREWRRNYSGGKTGEEAQEVRRGEGGKEGNYENVLELGRKGKCWRRRKW